MPLVDKKKHLSIKLYIALFFLLNTNVSFSQNKNEKGEMSGKVVEASTGLAMEYVNIALFLEKDSTLITGTITDKLGNFIIKNVPFDSFYVHINFIGYEQKEIRHLQISSQNKSIQLARIELSPYSVQIDEVDVKARQTQTVYAIDKKIIKVGSDLSSSGGNAINILESQAAVQVDGEGTVSLRGSNNFTVLINGRPGIFSGGEALQQIPAASVKNVEIITNPSAKYNPEGSAGIINVITKNNTLIGLNGLITVEGTHDGSNSTNLLLEYKTKKISYHLGFNYTHLDKGSTKKTNTKTFTVDSTINSNAIDTFTISSFGKGNIISDAPVFSGGMNFDINDRNKLSWGAAIGEKYDLIFLDIDYAMWRSPAFDSSFSKSLYNKDRSRDYRYFYFDYMHHFNSEGHEILWSGFIRQSESREAFTDLEYLLAGTDSSMIRDSESGNENFARLKIDYTLPLSDKSTFEAGYLIRSDSEKESYGNAYFNYPMDAINPVFTYSNSSDYIQNNQAVYSTFSSSLKEINFKLGVRGEYNSWRMMDIKDFEDFPKVENFDWFPSVHLSYTFGGGHNVSGSYSKRLDRPASNYLEPFESYSSYYIRRVGNPTLKPEYIDSYELNYRKDFEKSFVSVETYYRKTRNKIETYRSYRDEKTTLVSVRNVGHDMTFGAELALQKEIKNWWTITAYSLLYHYRVETGLNNDYRKTSIFNLFVKNKFTLKEKTYLQLDAVYNGGYITSQRVIKPQYLLSASVRRSFFDNKLTVALNVKDLFNSVKQDIESKGEKYISNTYMERYGPYFTLSLTYKINKLKKIKEPKEANEPDVNEF